MVAETETEAPAPKTVPVTCSESFGCKAAMTRYSILPVRLVLNGSRSVPELSTLVDMCPPCTGLYKYCRHTNKGSGDVDGAKACLFIGWKGQWHEEIREHAKHMAQERAHKKSVGNQIPGL